MMSKGCGNLLLTENGLETSHIPEKDRERIVLDFFNMKFNAERKKDCFYAISSVFSHNFSYGKFYPNFINMTWNEFKSHDSLKGIGQRVFDLMHSFCQNPNVRNLDDEKAFMQKEEPRAYTGYCNPTDYSEFVNNIELWEEWHRKWFSMHPLDIDWSNFTSDWLPRQDLIMEILKCELLLKFKEEGLTEEEAKRKLSLIEECDMVHEFHEQVMKHKGEELESYASKIGGKICRCNYYTYEKDLSDLEKQHANSLRQIYSIVNKNGAFQFISIDFKHGMFEFHDEGGTHQGEYRFDGSFNSDPESNHNLKCVKEWRRMYNK